MRDAVNHSAQRDPKMVREISLKEQYRKTVYTGQDYDYIVLSSGEIKVSKRVEQNYLPEYRESVELTADSLTQFIKELSDILWILKEGQ